MYAAAGESHMCQAAATAAASGGGPWLTGGVVLCLAAVLACRFLAGGARVIARERTSHGVDFRRTGKAPYSRSTPDSRSTSSYAQRMKAAFGRLICTSQLDRSRSPRAPSASPPAILVTFAPQSEIKRTP